MVETANYDVAVQDGMLDVYVTPEEVITYPVSPEWQAKGYPATIDVRIPGHVDVIGARSVSPVQVSSAPIVHQDEHEGVRHYIAGPTPYTDVLPAIAAAQAREGVQDPAQVWRVDCVQHLVLVEVTLSAFPAVAIKDAASLEVLYQSPARVWPGRPKRLV